MYADSPSAFSAPFLFLHVPCLFPCPVARGPRFHVCPSFSFPNPVVAHARDYFTAAGTSVAAAVLSPASDGYLQSKEASAASATATHRVAMAAAATAGVPWLAVDGVEAAGGRRLPTADAVTGIMRRVGGILAGGRRDEHAVVPVAVVGVDVFVDFVDATKWPPANVCCGCGRCVGLERLRVRGGCNGLVWCALAGCFVRGKLAGGECERACSRQPALGARGVWRVADLV